MEEILTYGGGLDWNDADASEPSSAGAASINE